MLPGGPTSRYPAGEYSACDDAKNAKLRKERIIGIEDFVCHIEHGDLLDILEHANPHGCTVPTSVPKRGPTTILRQSTPTKKAIKNGPEIMNFRPVL